MIHRTHYLTPVGQQVVRSTGYIGSFALAAAAAYALMMNVAFSESLHSARLAVVLIVLISLHLARFSGFLFSREIVLYAFFLVYMLIQLAWTDDLQLAVNTLMPATNFLLVLILFGSMMTYHRVHAVLAGVFSGFIAGALSYTGLTGFPFIYPAGFSYNAIALMYLFGLFATLLLACYKHSKAFLMITALLVLAHIVATASIKTNLGLLLGVIAAGLVYFRHFRTLIRRNLIPLVALLAVFGYFVASSGSLVESLERGVNRVSVGIGVLQAREDIPGYAAFESRDTWQKAGLAGWAHNPVFGNGVESFRAQFGITSHSTPVDLLHNSGLIGLALFYSIFASLAWRLFIDVNASAGNLRFLLFSTMICFLFITLSGTMHYNAFLAAFIAISAAVLRQLGCRTGTSDEFSRTPQ